MKLLIISPNDSKNGESSKETILESPSQFFHEIGEGELKISNFKFIKNKI